MPGLPGIGFKLTDDGNYDIYGKRLTNVSQPTDGSDGTTKAYVDTENSKQNIAIADKASKNDLNTKLNIDGSKSMTGNLNMNNKKITSLAESVDDNDAVSLKVLKEHTNFHQNNYHLQPSFTFYKNQTLINPINIPNTIPGHTHLDLYITSKDNSDDGFGGNAWVNLRMTNTLKTGLYSVVFETFAELIGNSTLNDETLITNVHGDGNYRMINFSHDYQTTHSKVYIQFTSNGKAGQITFQIRYYGSSYNKNIKFLFFSCVVSGRQNNTFNHDLFDVNDVQLQNQILYFEDVNLNGNMVSGLGDPQNDTDATNKRYIDTEIANLHVDASPLLPRDGIRKMTGDLNMDDNHILSVDNLTDYKEDDPLEVRVRDLKSVVNKEYLNTKFLKKDKNDNNFDLKQNIIKNCEPYYDGVFDDNSLVSKAFVDAEMNKLPKPETDVLKLDGSKAMTGNLDMGGKAINNIKDPSNGQDAATKIFVDNAIVAQNTYILIELGKKLNLISGTLTGDLDMNNNEIKNLKDPQVSDNTYAATVNFVNKTISDSNSVISNLIDKKIKESETSSIDLVDQENVFKRVMDNDEFKEDDDDIHKVGVQNKDFHLVNKKTYGFKIDYDSDIGYYNTRLSIDLIYLDAGSYTMVFEMYVDDGITIDEIEGASGTLSGVTTKSNIDGTKTRSLIHFSYNGLASGFNDLDIDIKLKSKTDPQTTIYVVVYGVKGNVNNVSVGLWDRLYYYDNDSIKYEVPIDMKGKKSVGNGTSNSDAVNYQQLIDHIKTINSYFFIRIIWNMTTKIKSNFQEYPITLIQQSKIQKF